MIGMILLAAIAVMIFFGLTDRFFSKMGVAKWVAFLIVLAFAVAAVFPPLVTGGNVSFSYAGFFLPLLLGVVAMFALGANSSLLRAIVGAMAIAGITVASRIAVPPVGNYGNAVASILIVGFAGGITAFIIGQGRLAMLASVLCGVVLGDFICAMLFRFVTGATGTLFMLGQNGIFDTLIVTALVGGISLEIGNLIRRSVTSRQSAPVAVQFEAGEDVKFDSEEKRTSIDEEDDLFEDYFNDDVD